MRKLSERERFINYVLMIYGREGTWILRREGKHLTKYLVAWYVRESFPRPGWGGGDSVDRESFRREVLAPAGWYER